MIRFVFGVLWLFPAAALAADQPPTPAKALEALKRDQMRIEEKFSTDYQKCKTEAEKNKLFEARQKNMQVCVRRALDLARQHPKDAAAFAALEWIVTGGLGYCPETWQALDLVRRNYLSDPRLGKICLYAQIYRTNYAGTEDFLRAVLKKNPDRNVQGVACFTLARVLKDYAAWADVFRKDPARVKLLEKYYPAELMRKVKTADSAKLRQEAERYYRQTLAKYGDVKSPGSGRLLGRRAEGALFEIQHLQVGQRAPEIEGEDIAGKRFKLSDYRGKVVLLDFWGNW
jgi:hypothetical protein